jgi:hypothetical protein
MRTASHPTLWAGLPAGGWQVDFWADADGRTQLDVLDATDSLVFRLTGTPFDQCSQITPSIDGAWAGGAPGTDPDGRPQRWALAVGQTPDGILRAVSFVDDSRAPRRERGAYPWDAMSWLRVTEDGLWVAAALGSFTHVRLVTQSADLLHPLRVVDVPGSDVTKPDVTYPDVTGQGLIK